MNSFQVSATHQRLTVELTDMAESEQQTEQNTLENEEAGHDMRRISNSNRDQSYIMRDWILVAAGLERLFFTIYAMAFAVITAVYV